jgi:hypothetical protein
MKLEDALKTDLGKLTPQQRSHLRKRLMAAGMPIPPELCLKKGGDTAECASGKDDNGPWRCVVVADGMERTYVIGGENV